MILPFARTFSLPISHVTCREFLTDWQTDSSPTPEGSPPGYHVPSEVSGNATLSSRHRTLATRPSLRLFLEVFLILRLLPFPAAA